MDEKLIKNIYPLLTEEFDGKGEPRLKGPMSPVMVADHISKTMNFPYNHLARVTFNDDKVLNIFEKGEGYTGYDHLIMVTKTKKIVRCALIVDMGSHIMPVAVRVGDDKLVVTSVYKKDDSFKYKLDNDEINHIFDYMFEKSSRYITKSPNNG